MKGRKIITGFLLAGVLMGAGYNCYNLVQNNASANVVNQNVVYAEKNQEVKLDAKDEALKSKAMEEIKKYYGEAPDFNKLKFNIRDESVVQQIEEIDRALDYAKSIPNKTKEDEKWIKDLEADKTKINFGRISMGWTLTNENNDLFEIYSVDFNDQTKEVLSVTYKAKPDLSKIKAENLMNLENAKKTAEEFILKNKLDDIKSVKLIGNTEYETYYTDSYKGTDTFFFMYQDAKDASKKVNVEINRATGKVTYFSVGEGAAEYTKNDVE